MRLGVILTGILSFAASQSALGLDSLCRNDEKCFGIGVTSTAQPDLQHSVGRWPLPKSGKMTAAVGQTLHFEWDSRNEYFIPAQKKWTKAASGLTTSWELADKGGDPKAKDPCTGEAPGPWKAQTQTGSLDWELKECAASHTWRIKIRADQVLPKTPEAALEIKVVKGPPAPSPAPAPSPSPLFIE